MVSKLEKYINTEKDLYEMLDNLMINIPWDNFYTERIRPAPFLVQNNLPDENLVSFINNNSSVKRVIDLGCGEGRNAIYLAQKGIDITAIDFSEVAINNAKIIAQKANVVVNFIADNVLSHDYMNNKYDLVYDSGLFHSLPPHRRLQYLELINSLTVDKGYFGLVCFAWGEECAGESVDDWHFYDKKLAGQAFKKERLKDFFSKYFNMIEIRKYRNSMPNTIQGLDFLWICLFKKK